MFAVGRCLLGDAYWKMFTVGCYWTMLTGRCPLKCILVKLEQRLSKVWTLNHCPERTRWACTFYVNIGFNLARTIEKSDSPSRFFLAVHGA